MDARWTLERVQERISRGIIVDENVVDIEQNTLVKLGTHISADEGEAAQFVAHSIGHPLPRIYATLHDGAAGGHLHRAGEAARRAPDDSSPDDRCYLPPVPVSHAR
jgi:hypothetical protein